MYPRPITLLVALFCAGPLVSAGAATPPKHPLRVTSTLDAKTVLPHRIRWIAVPHSNGAPVSEVDFLIDGKVRWIERNAPFTYSDDGASLVTSFLTAGRHRFTVRARTFDGRTATDTVRARVLATPAPAAELAGKWQRDVPQRVPADAGASGSDSVPAGTWTIDFDRRWLESTAPGQFDAKESQDTGFGYIIDSDYTPGPGTFHIAGSVTVNVFRDEDPRGGWWCESWGPEANYTWSVNGDTLTLTPVSGVDPCHQRGGILAGTWTKAA